jgi:hypothetical protein
MVFKLEIECDNEAFTDCPEIEVARILRDAAKRVEMQSGLDYSTSLLRDANGNTVGHFVAENG